MPAPSVESSLYPFAWHGLRLSLPREVNLSGFAGTARRGGLTFSELRGPVLFVRWATPRAWRGRAAGQWERMLRRVRRGRVERLSAHAAMIALERPVGEWLLLAHDGRRVIEVHLPAQQGAMGEAWLRGSTEGLQAGSASRWQWEVYGARAIVPEYARLVRAQLMPGATRLSFCAWGGVRVECGALSLACALLKQMSLRAVVEAQVPLAWREAMWEESGAQVRATGLVRRALRQRRVSLEAEHDDAANQIRWRWQSG